MPKKPNAHGMQEYVPAGNGDASGEYADGEGSNRHFAAFKKPDGKGETNTPAKVQKETPNVTDGIKVEPNKTGQSYKGFDEYIEKGFKPGKYLSKEQLRRDFERGNEEARGAISHFIEKGDITYQSSQNSYFSPSSKHIYMNTNDTGERRDGATFYHESAHAIDWALGEAKNAEYLYVPKAMMTETRLTSNGKTLWGTISAEMQAMKKSGVWKSAIEDYNTFLKTGLVEKTDEELIEEASFDREIDSLRQEARNYAFDASKPYATASWTKYQSVFKEAREKYIDEHISPELREKRDRIKKRNEEISKENRQRKSAYDTLSDIYGAAYKKSYGFSGTGHTATYYRNSPEGAAHEFFAEYFSAMATGHTELIETTKKYMPETAKACEELYQYAISQRG